MVVADNEQQAKIAITNIEVKYQTLPVVNSMAEAIKPDAVLIHEKSRDLAALIPPPLEAGILGVVSHQIK